MENTEKNKISTSQVYQLKFNLDEEFLQKLKRLETYTLNNDNKDILQYRKAESFDTDYQKHQIEFTYYQNVNIPITKFISQ